MSEEHPTPNNPQIRALLRYGEQLFVGFCVFVFLVALTTYCAVRGLQQDRLIEFDHAPPQSVTFQVDINSAEWPELVQLPDIGEATARRIVEQRNAGGPYSDLEDLRRRVHGVGPRLVETIEPYIAPIAIPKGDRVHPDETTVSSSR